MSEVLDLLRILGLSNALRMKSRYDEALPHLRGYATTTVLWSLLECGLGDRLLAAGDAGLDVDGFVREQGLDAHVMRSMLSYLDGISVVRVEGGQVRLLPSGRHLIGDTRGLFELAYAYEPLFTNLSDLLHGRKQFARGDVARRIEYVGRGSGMLCRDLPYPVMADIIARHGCRRVLDLGCGDLALVTFLCERMSDLTAVGVDLDADMIAYCRRTLAESPFASRIEVATGDLRHLDDLIASGRLAGVDCVTAVDTFHEYLWTGTDEILAALKKLRSQFPKVLFVIGEFCNQPHESLRRRPTAFLEHHLFHDLTNQKIGEAELWRRLFREAGFQIVEERIFNLVGHGYFALRP
ncbi:MAG TPA: class I SAM-dependent methyltransferase [Phycisphaerae bacterium]|nr:class I SAM-dependent methyltransferase [Phycisphaerae bacterium]